MFFSSPALCSGWAIWSLLVCHPSVHPSINIFKRLLLWSCGANFALRVGKWKIAKMVTVRWPRWLPCPYMIKTFKTLHLQNWGCLGAESLQESSGMGGLPKLLKELSYVDVWPFYGKVKFASLCICVSLIHLNGKIVENFKRLLLWSLWANFAQISYGATLG